MSQDGALIQFEGATALPYQILVVLGCQSTVICVALIYLLGFNDRILVRELESFSTPSP